MKKQLLFTALFVMVITKNYAQKFIDLTNELTNITRNIEVNGNDYATDEQVIITTPHINFKNPSLLIVHNALLNVPEGIRGVGKIKLQSSSKLYVKNNPQKGKLMSKKPFGKEFYLIDATIFKGMAPDTKFTIWDVGGAKLFSKTIADISQEKISRMHYLVKMNGKFLDKTLLTD